MGAQRTSFAKLQRDRAKKANAAAKRERRQSKPEETDEEATPLAPVDSGGELSAGELLEQIEQIHRQFQAKQIDQEQYDEKKAELLARLPID